jgi:hypothetical protein
MTDNNQLNYSLDKNEIRIDYTILTPRFTVTNNDSLNDGIIHLNEHGYAIFSDVMHQDEINNNKELLWNFLENIPGRHIQRNDPTTWSNNWQEENNNNNKIYLPLIIFLGLVTVDLVLSMIVALVNLILCGIFVLIGI